VRKREAAEDRLLQRRDRVLGRNTGGYGRSAGLSVAGLEADDDGMPSTKSRMIKKRKTTNRRGDIYSDDEDPTMPRHRTREDEYDREDDFVADSDEEPEMYDDGEAEEEVLDEGDDDLDKDDLEIEGRQTVLDDRTRGDKGRDRGKLSKRSRMDEIEAEDDDAEGEEDTEFLKQTSLLDNAGGGGRKRRVIDDDDEEE
jgi:RNA polymerase-associated protein LEO1